jgi:predicted nucleic acid-binding protein
MLDGAAHVEIVDRTDLDRALAVREAYPDQTFSLVDCTSFVVMERLRIHRVATYDDDFAVYRHGPRQDRAFQVVR